MSSERPSPASAASLPRHIPNSCRPRFLAPMCPHVGSLRFEGQQTAELQLSHMTFSHKAAPAAGPSPSIHDFLRQGRRTGCSTLLVHTRPPPGPASSRRWFASSHPLGSVPRRANCKPTTLAAVRRSDRSQSHYRPRRARKACPPRNAFHQPISPPSLAPGGALQSVRMETAKPGSPTNSSPRTLGIPAITVQDSPLQIAPPIFVFAASRIHVGYISRITLTNTSASAAVAFKFKTNAPTRYSVKPVYGILEPSKSMEVLVRCESSLESQDRFQLQVVTLQSEETARFASTSWKSVAATRIKDLLLDCRLMQNTTPGPTVGRKASQELKAEKPSNPTIKFHDAPPPYTPQGTNSAPAMIHSSPYMGVPQSSPGIALYTPTQEKADPPMLSGWRQISIFQLVLIAILCIALGVVLDYKSAAVTLEQMMRW